MRFAALLVLAGCGRLDFGPQAQRDAAPVDDGMVDAAPSDLTIWLRMEDDPTDGQLEDSAGGDNPALCASCGVATPGHVGQGTLFDPALSQYYAIANAVQLTTPDAFTIALWVRLDSVSVGEKYIAFTKRFSTIHNSWSLIADLDDVWYFESADATPMGDYPAIDSIAVGVWTHFALSWDNASKRAYKNGVKMLDVIPPDIAFDGGDVLLGADQDVGPGVFGYFKGAIDEVRVYNRKLSDFEIQQLAAE